MYKIVFLTVIVCLAWATAQAQSVDSKIGIKKVYLPHFRVQEASGKNVQAIGIRWMLSSYQLAPLEFGFHAAAGYGEVARLSYGFNLNYDFSKWKNNYIKAGLSWEGLI